MKKEKYKKSPEEIQVHLKSILGVKPGVYLTVLYGFILLVILFLVFVLPGIKNNGTRFSVVTTPEASVVFVDNLYRGTTPAEIFIKRGSHTITIKKDFFKTVVIKKNVKGRLFFSLIFPRSLSLKQPMQLTDPEGFLKKRYREISGYALMNDYYKGYQYPHLITRTVKEFKEGTGERQLSDLYKFLYMMRYNVGNQELLADYSEAVRYVESQTGSGSSHAKNSDLKDIEGFYRNHGFPERGLLLAYLAALPEKTRTQVPAGSSQKDISTLFSRISTVQQEKPEVSPNKTGALSHTVGSFRFLRVPGGEYTAGTDTVTEDSFLHNVVPDNFPHRETVHSFYMLESEVTKKQYASFLKDNPFWNEQSRDTLVRKHLVTGDYLKDFSSLPANVPVSEISWYAAEAFASWLTSNLPASLKNFEVRLPTEGEWEWAARLDSHTKPVSVFLETASKGPLPPNFQRQGALGLEDMLGNLWEWCDNYYFPADTLFGSFGLPGTGYEGAEKAVRGGSWANSGRSVTPATRGSQDPSWCTPFLGFRLVLVKKVS